MKRKISKNKKRDNGRVMKKMAPHNVCDRFCERCDYRKKCGVFQNIDIVQMKDAAESGDLRHIKSVFMNLERELEEVKETLRMAIGEARVDYGVVANEKKHQNHFDVRLNIKNELLYKMSKKFAKNADAFLKKIFLFSQNNNPFLLPALNEDIGNLSFYFGTLLSKVHYALLCAYDSDQDEKQKYARANYSICIALNACIVCEKSISNIAREVPEFFVEHLELITILKDIRSGIKRTFPDVERFQNDIIFNTPLR